MRHGRVRCSMLLAATLVAACGGEAKSGVAAGAAAALGGDDSSAIQAKLEAEAKLQPLAQAVASYTPTAVGRDAQGSVVDPELVARMKAMPKENLQKWAGECSFAVFGAGDIAKPKHIFCKSVFVALKG